MKQEDKELLFIDLCNRIHYKTICTSKRFDKSILVGMDDDGATFSYVDCLGQTVYELLDIIEFNVKPYLRPMSSMTEEEIQDAREKFFEGSDHYDIDDIGEIYADTGQPYTSIYTLSFVRLFGYVDWLNAHHFDYRGLIGKGLAIEVTKENNPYES